MRLPQVTVKLAFAMGMAFTASCFTALAAIWQMTGAWAPVAVLCSAFIALFIMSTVGELASRFPSAVGVRTYVKAAFGERSSLFTSFLYMALVLLVASLESILVANIFGTVLPAVNGVAIIFILFATLFLINLIGYEFSSHLQLVLVIALCVCIGLLAWGGISSHTLYGTGLQFTTVASYSALVEAVIIGVFLFAGIEWVTVLQVRNPGEARHIHVILLLAVVCLAVLYLAFVIGLVSHGQTHGQTASGFLLFPQVNLATSAYGQGGMVLVILLTLLAVATTFNSGLVGASRLTYALAREGYLPRLLTYTHPATGNPIAATAAVVLAAMAGSYIAYFNDSVRVITETSASIACIVYVMFLASAAKLRRIQAGRVISFRSPAPTWMLVGGAIGMAGLLIATVMQSILIGRILVMCISLFVLSLSLILVRRNISRSSLDVLPTKG